MSVQRIMISLLAVVTAVGLSQIAAAAELDSGLFSHQYNGDVYPPPGYTAYDGWAVAPTTDGDILSFRADVDSGGGFIDSNQWASAISDAVGWTMELRIKIGTDYAEGAVGAFNMVFQDNGANPAWSVYRINQGSLKTDGGTAVAAVDNTDDFHVYRFAQDSGSNLTKIWRDGELLSAGVGATRHYSPNFYWGDGGGGIGGPTIYLDYLRFDNTGAYDPAGFTPPPEPVVFYRENFAHPSDSPPLGLNHAGWYAHHGAAAVAVSGLADEPVDLSIVDGAAALPGVNNNSPDATPLGYTWHWDLAEAQPHLLWTDEYTLANVSQIETISWEQLHTGTNIVPHAAVRIGGNWYASNEAGEIVVDTTLFDTAELDFQTATWSSLNFTPDSVLALGDSVGSLPDGDITAFGLFIPEWPEGEGKLPYLRFDNFAISGVPEPGVLTLLLAGLLAGACFAIRRR